LLSTRLEANQVCRFQLQFRGVLDQHEPVVRGQQGGEGVEQCGFACAGSAADQNVVASVDG
jgi:hypothetical protein